MAGGDREKALDAALANIEKQFGKGSVMRLGDETRAPLEVIPTGSIALDVALGLGGLPRGRVVEIYGPESSGKTTVALHAVANAQRAGGIVAFIDAEHALDPDYAKALGVDTDALLVSQPDSGEQALEIADMLIRSGALDLIVIDSVAALVPRAEIEGEMGDSHVGLQARLMSQALRKMTGALNNSGTTMIFINQLREKIGVMFGSPETTTGGRALKFYSSVRLDVRRIETLKDGTDMVGNRTRVKVVKNKVAPPFKQAEFDIMYGKGISREGGLIDVGVEAGLVRKAGAWYTYEGDQLGQGKENARTFLKDNPDLANELEKKILEKLGVGPTVDAPADDLVRRAASVSMTSEPLARRRLGAGVEAWTAPAAAADRRRPRRGRAGPDADPESVARKILLDQLTGRARSRKELADKLAEQGRARRASPTRLLDRFEEVGLVDDEAFARLLGRRPPARQGAGPAGAGPGAAPQGRRRRGRPRGARRDRPRRRGGRGPRAGPQEAALASSRVDDTTATRRLVGMLARKGYAAGLAFAVVRDELGADGRGGRREQPSTGSPRRGRMPRSTGHRLATAATRLRGVVRAGESWAAAARRTCASHARRARRRSTSPGRSSSSTSTTTPGGAAGDDPRRPARRRPLARQPSTSTGGGPPTASRRSSRSPRSTARASTAWTPTRMWVVEVNGRSVGFCQDYRIGDYPELRRARARPGRDRRRLRHRRRRTWSGRGIGTRHALGLAAQRAAAATPT